LEKRQSVSFLMGEKKEEEMRMYLIGVLTVGGPADT